MTLKKLRMISVIRTSLLFLFLCLWAIQSYATHLKAGQIVVYRLTGTQFKIVLTLYMDATSVDVGVDEDSATLKFSDGTSMTRLRDTPKGIFIGNATYESTYTFIRSFGNSSYSISYQQENRNAGVLNMDQSGVTPFYIETTFKVSPFIGMDNLPTLLVPPVDVGAVGQTYIHNPGAYDPEGDSLSYELVTPRQNTGLNVLGYAHPNQKPQIGGSFSLNPITGDLIWDTPLVEGLYNVAIIIKEWRNGQVIGSIVRDMQILIKDDPNKRPILQIPKDTCIVAGTSLTFVPVLASDVNDDKINLTSISGLYTLPSSPATFSLKSPNPQTNPASGDFHWLTNCNHVRDEPYQVIFKAEDAPNLGQRLFDLRSWNIRVFAPAPENLQIINVDKGFQLSWDTYSCNMGKMEIYRRICDTIDFIPAPCEDGLPLSLGYVKIGEVPIGTTTYTDTVDVHSSQIYHYKIFAVFPEPKGGKSFVSKGVVGKTKTDALPISASVLKTDSVNGKVLLKWTQPQTLDIVAFPGPYQYRLQRAVGITGENYSAIAILNSLSDTVFIDSLINTKNVAYNYLLDFYYTGTNGLSLKSRSLSFSTVSLSSSPGNQKVNLLWSYEAPWLNSGQYHRIYKKNDLGIFVLLDSVLVSGQSGSYTDTGLNNGDTVCYYVETQGVYCNNETKILNNSNMICEVPRDDRPPCPPVLFGPTDCVEESVTQLTIKWKPDLSSGCNIDIKGYNVYYSEFEGEAPLLFASNVTDTFLVDIDNFSLAGCYVVKAVNFYGIESAFSNKVCVDLCAYYELPNLITPNGDNKNDIFEPFPIPQNVNQVKFSVYNRWGKLVYYSEDDINLNWNGVNSDGEFLSSGLYYFYAEVIFKRRLRKADQVKNIKGWVHIIRKAQGDLFD